MITTKEFIKNYPNFLDCSIQTFDDRKTLSEWDMPYYAWHTSASSVDWNKVKHDNDNLRCWVFFSVNSMVQWQRSKNAVTNINSWIVECDVLSKDEQMSLIDSAPIRPSCIIESQKSYHIYYFAVDWDKETYEQIWRWLAKYYQWDIALCSDYARVLRLPWTKHNKWEPFVIKCLEMWWNKYTKEEMMKHFPYEKEKKKSEKKTIKWESTNIWDYMWSLWNKEMLWRISGSSLVWWEFIDFKKNSDWTEQIIVNWEATWARIDEANMIWSTKEWWPTWIQRCKYYWKNSSTILKWFYEFCSDIVPDMFTQTERFIELDKAMKIDKEEEKQKTLELSFRHITQKEKIEKWFEELMLTNPKNVIKRWWEEWDSYLWWIYGGKIYLIWAQTWTWKTTFVNQVADNVSKAWVRVTRYSLEDRMEDNAKEEIYYQLNRYRVSQWRKPVEWIHFNNWEYWNEWSIYADWSVIIDLSDCYNNIIDSDIIDLDKAKDVHINDLASLMEAECDKWTKVFVIDHLHYFRFNHAEREDLEIEWAMKKINEIARRRNVAVFLIAHYNSAWSSDAAPSLSQFKWSSSIKQIANIAIQIVRDENDLETAFHITKLRWPIQKKIIFSWFDKRTYQYSFTKTSEQVKKEKERKRI